MDWIIITEDNLPPEDEVVILFVSVPHHFTGWPWKSQHFGCRNGDQWEYGDHGTSKLVGGEVTHFAYPPPNPDGSVGNPANKNDSRYNSKCPTCGAHMVDCTDDGNLDANGYHPKRGVREL